MAVTGKCLIDETSLSDVANAIRAKGGTSATLEYPDGFVNAINAMKFVTKRKTVATDATSLGLVTIPIDTMSNFQVINISLLESYSGDVMRIETLTITLSNGTIDGFSIISTKADGVYGATLTRNSVISNPNQSFDPGIISLTKNVTSITIEVDTRNVGYFHGRYSCEIFGY